MLVFGNEHVNFDAIQPPGRAQAVRNTLEEEQGLALHALTLGLAKWNDDLDLRHAYKVLGQGFAGHSNPAITGRAKTCQEFGASLIDPPDSRQVEGAMYYLCALCEGLRQKVAGTDDDDTIRSAGPRYRSMHERAARERDALRAYLGSRE